MVKVRGAGDRVELRSHALARRLEVSAAVYDGDGGGGGGGLQVLSCPSSLT